MLGFSNCSDLGALYEGLGASSSDAVMAFADAVSERICDNRYRDGGPGSRAQADRLIGVFSLDRQ